MEVAVVVKRKQLLRAKFVMGVPSGGFPGSFGEGWVLGLTAEWVRSERPLFVSRRRGRENATVQKLKCSFIRLLVILLVNTNLARDDVAMADGTFPALWNNSKLYQRARK